MGQVTKENIDQRVEDWHNSDSTLPLHEYLGMSFEDYAYWGETGRLRNRAD